MLTILTSGALILGGASASLFKTASASPSVSSTSSLSQESSVLQAAVSSELHPHLSLNSGQPLSDQALLNDKRPSFDAGVDEYGNVTNDQISVYIVREGDTISTIADMFDVSINTIRWANNMNSKSVLRKDQQLIILPISGLKYTVKKGDTLKNISSSYNADENEILSYNNLAKASDLKVGDEIIIPNGEVTTSVTTKSNSNSKNTASSATKSSGYFTRPIKGGVRTQGIHGHNGVDLASKLGTPVMAAAGGKVIIAMQGGWNGGYGNYVVISHANGMQTLYAHLNSVSVSAGDTVSQGTVIGGMGTTGKSTGVHLHFEVRGGTNPF